VRVQDPLALAPRIDRTAQPVDHPGKAHVRVRIAHVEPQLSRTLELGLQLSHDLFQLWAVLGDGVCGLEKVTVRVDQRGYLVGREHGTPTQRVPLGGDRTVQAATAGTTSRSAAKLSIWAWICSGVAADVNLKQTMRW